jgi:phosphoglycerate dehydrogenase-like enzyme
MPSPFQVVITDFLDDATVETPVLGDLAQITLAGAHDEAGLARHLPGADALIVYHEVPMLTDASWSLAGKCRGVARAGVGFNNLDIVAAGRRGIAVCNVPDYGTEEVADHAIMMLLAAARNLVRCHSAIQRGDWNYRTALDSPRMRGRTLGLVGCGRIGTATALRAKALGLDVVFHDPFAPPGLDKALGIRRVDQLDALLEQSHFLSIHCYLDESTRHLIDAKGLARMPPGGIVVNTARGPIIDQAALLDALDSGHLKGAALDVVEREPLDDDRLRIIPRSCSRPIAPFTVSKASPNSAARPPRRSDGSCSASLRVA